LSTLARYSGPGIDFKKQIVVLILLAFRIWKQKDFLILFSDSESWWRHVVTMATISYSAWFSYFFIEGCLHTKFEVSIPRYGLGVGGLKSSPSFSEPPKRLVRIGLRRLKYISCESCYVRAVFEIVRKLANAKKWPKLKMFFCKKFSKIFELCCFSSCSSFQAPFKWTYMVKISVLPNKLPKLAL